MHLVCTHAARIHPRNELINYAPVRQASGANSRQRISFVLSDVQRRQAEEAAQPQAQAQAQAQASPQAPDEVAVAAAVDQYHQAHAHARHAAPAYHSTPPPAYHPQPPHPPPALPRSRGPTPCAWSLACLGLAGCLGFCALLLVEVPWVTLEGSAAVLQQRRTHAQAMRRQQQLHGSALPPRVRLGLWDEHGVISPLQLNVILSLATGVEEQHVHVADEGSHFFAIEVEGEGAWLIDAINAPDNAFVHTLNQQASTFGARMVVSHAAQDVGTTSAPS